MYKSKTLLGVYIMQHTHTNTHNGKAIWSSHFYSKLCGKVTVGRWWVNWGIVWEAGDCGKVSVTVRASTLYDAYPGCQGIGSWKAQGTVGPTVDGSHDGWPPSPTPLIALLTHHHWASFTLTAPSLMFTTSQKHIHYAIKLMICNLTQWCIMCTWAPRGLRWLLPQTGPARVTTNVLSHHHQHNCLTITPVSPTPFPSSLTTLHPITPHHHV